MKELDTEKLESKENVKYVGSLRMLRNPNSPNYGYQRISTRCGRFLLYVEKF